MRTVWIAVLISLALSLPADAAEVKEPIGLTDQSVREVSDKVLEQLLVALQEEDQAAFTAAMAPELRARSTNGGFQTLLKAYKKDYGSLSPAVYLGFINGAESSRTIYKVYSHKHQHERQITLEFSRHVIENEQTGSTREVIYLLAFNLE